MKHTTAVIIGAGQAGLAMSRCLAERGIDHVVLERGHVAQRWRDRWDSLRLLTPNRQTQLPGFDYRGPEPDGFMTKDQLVAHLQAYAKEAKAPVIEGTEVFAVTQLERERFAVVTNRGTWLGRSLVLATGYCDQPRVPRLAQRLAREIEQFTPKDYQHPGQLPDGGVLIVGASATGVQLASEIRRSGRPVTLAVGRHTRLPRRYRGRDILDWLELTGILSETNEQVRDLTASRNSPSLQLVGDPKGRSLDLAVLQDLGVQLVGRARDADGTRMAFDLDLPQSTAAADAKLERLLGRIDSFIERFGIGDASRARARFEPMRIPLTPAELDLEQAGLRSVVWATGFSRSYPWLRLPVLDRRGELIHDGGVTPVVGLYVLGLNFLRRRNSSFLSGVGRDAFELSEAIATQLSHPRSRAA